MGTLHDFVTCRRRSRRRRSSIRIVHARGAIPNEMGPTQEEDEEEELGGGGGGGVYLESRRRVEKRA